MSLESPWLGGLGAIVVPALGHLYHFILAVNITSGWGLRETHLARTEAGAGGDPGGLALPFCSPGTSRIRGGTGAGRCGLTPVSASPPGD